MQKKNNKYVLSAGDLNGFMNCKRLTQLDTMVVNGQETKPEFSNPHLKVMQERGFEHEKQYINHLQESGLSFAMADVESGEDGYQKTIGLMKSGVDIISQGVLSLEGWYGRSDILKKVSLPSRLGDYSYIVIDTKLSRETKAGSLMQLCLYSEMVSEIQGTMPEEMYVVTPIDKTEFNEEKYRVNDYQAYYRLVRNQLLSALEKIDVYPEPVSHCDICKWWEKCTKRRRQDDHLSLVANITKSQRKELSIININTVKDLSEVCATQFNKLPSGTNVKSLVLAKEQARVQVEGRESGNLVSEYMPFEGGRGLSRLPEPNSGDIFFDIEGDVFVGSSGLEYLFGLTYFQDGHKMFKGIWAENPKKEKKAFSELMEFFCQRLKEFPDFHIYHYSSYEPGAVKRLVQRYGIFEEEVDRLLRGKKFIDLYGVTRQGIRASVESYSLKELEVFTGYNRQINLNDLIVHKRALEHNLELGRYDDITELMKSSVEKYNNDDTDSTYYLREWLEKKRADAISLGNLILRPEIPTLDSSQEISERDKKLNEIREQLIAGVDLNNELSVQEKARCLLGDLVSFYRREEKVAWWELFRLKEMNEQELLEDKFGISGLDLIERIAPQGKGRVFTDVYSYPYQEVDFRSGDEIYDYEVGKIGILEEFDPFERILKIKKTTKTNDVHPKSVFRFSKVPIEALEDSSIQVCEEIIENGFSGEKFKAIKDILLLKEPNSKMPISYEGEDILGHAIKVVRSLNNSYLPIQGPPGTGKSYTGSHLIQNLLNNKKKIGVCAVSHKVINGLLTSVKDLVHDEYKILHKLSEKNSDYIYEVTTKNEDCVNLSNGSAPVLVGGTSWLFSRDDMEGALDYLFVDEAGQLSLANLVSISRCAKNIVLLGDCQQLEQPIQASHPEGADLSALEYIQGDADTIAKNMGLFLSITYRLHPEICAFNSELFYESRLESVKGNEHQKVSGPMNLNPLMYKEVVHSGNTSYSMEEVNFISSFIEKILDAKHLYTIFDSKKGDIIESALTAKDIMVIAPYNAQVQRLKSKLPSGIEIGTVDKFQGREGSSRIGV